MQLAPIDLVRGEVSLPLLPALFQRFVAKLEDPNAQAEDFAGIIETDPSLTAKLLRIVNSAYYSFSADISDVSHAVTIVGLNELRELVLAVSVVEFFDELPNDLVNMKVFWQHSVLTGLVLRELQQLPATRTAQSMFTAGLLHDIGCLVYYNKLPEIANSVLQLSETAGQPRFLVEQQLLGFDHAAVGAELTRHWRLPPFLSEVVGNHHAPQLSKKYLLESRLLCLADQLAKYSPDQNESEVLDNWIGDLDLSLSRELAEASLDKARQQLISVMQAINL